MASLKTLIVALALSLMLFASGAIAQVSISLPADGLYEAGQFMQVIVHAEGAARDGSITLTAPGALPTTIEMGGQPSVTMPVLMLSADVQRLSWSLNGSPPREVEMPLTPKLSSATTPLDSSIAGADVYAPTLEWEPGASVRVRRMSILGAVLIAIALLACPLLLRGRQVIAGVVVVVAVSATGIAIGSHYISPIWRAEGQIVVGGADGTAQIDTWQFITTRSVAETSTELPSGAKPMFVDPQHARDVHASIHFDAAKDILSLRCKLQPRMKVAILHRRVIEPASPPPTTQPIARALKSPMAELARREYVHRDTRIVDEGSVQWIDDQLVHWPSVILWREKR